MMRGHTDTGDSGSFDPRQAAALLDQTTQQTRRRIEPAQPWLLAVRAVIALTIYGAVWLSVRGQHPYQHPTAAVIPVVVVLVAVNFAATLAVARRATAGISGRSRLRRAGITVLAVIWAGVFAVLGALAGAGVSRAVLYGTYPAAAPLIAAGPAGAWAVAGAGLCAVLLGTAAAITWRQRRSAVRP